MYNVIETAIKMSSIHWWKGLIFISVNLRE